jgi:lipoprotein-anchoring transpeptidase ErfK/SrfK
MFFAALMFLWPFLGSDTPTLPLETKAGLLENIGEANEFPLLMRVVDLAVVRRGSNTESAITSRISPGAVLQMRQKERSSSCPAGWMERKEGGFICAQHLKKTDENEAHPALDDDPYLPRRLIAMEVIRDGLKLYRNKKDIERHSANIKLRLGSVLTVLDQVNISGKAYCETRDGWLVEAENLKTLPQPLTSLSTNIGDTGAELGGIVISEKAQVRLAPQPDGMPARQLDRWSVIPRRGDALLEAENGWVPLPDGGYIADDEIARLRHPPKPRQIGTNERWIAVDLQEQLLYAYEGEQLVRVVPCSTGKNGNTKPGRYRIGWKRRLQTMQLMSGHVRVDDVQWVMYYDRENSIAIHSAYWHSNFGRPVSHGCVNLPLDDAKWLFEWSAPRIFPVDSESFPVPGQPGTQVIVFK